MQNTMSLEFLVHSLIGICLTNSHMCTHALPVLKDGSVFDAVDNRIFHED